MTGKGWVAAGDLVVGDKVHIISGDAGTVTDLKPEKMDKPIPVYNLEIADFHSYFVSNGILVHNNCQQYYNSNDPDAEPVPGQPNLFKGIPTVPDGYTQFQEEKVPLTSDTFKEFLKSIGENPKRWSKVMVKYMNNDGELFQQHYWSNGNMSFFHK